MPCKRKKRASRDKAKKKKRAEAPPGRVSNAIKVRKGLINKPKVLRHVDHKGYGLVRVLTREKDFFPEFAVYPDRSSRDVIQSLRDAGLKDEQRGKWVLRTDRFNIFVYV